MSDYRIFTDSGCDIDRKTLEDWGVVRVDLTFMDSEKEYPIDAFTSKEFYDEMRGGRVFKTSAPAPVPASRHEIPETVYIDGQPLPQHEVSKEVRTAVDNSVSIDGQRGTISEIVAKNDRKMPESFTRMMQPETYDAGVWFGDVEPTSAMRRAAMERLRSEEEERQKRMKKNFKPMADRGMKQIDVSRAHVIGVKDESKNKVVPISQGGKGGNAYRELLLAGKDPSDLSLNDHILLMHHQGKSNMAIARELGLGIGEVTLVIELSKKQRVVKDNNG